MVRPGSGPKVLGSIGSPRQEINMADSPTTILAVTRARRLRRLWVAGVLGVVGAAGTVVLMLGWGGRAPAYLQMAALASASGGLSMFVAMFVFPRLVRSRLRGVGIDVCPYCSSHGVLGPADESCPSCGSPRGCAGCGQRLLADQRACPECGRAVRGRGL